METHIQNINFFNLLYTASRHDHIRLPVPKTLIKGNGFRKPTLIQQSLRRNLFKELRPEEIESTITNTFIESPNLPCAIIKSNNDRTICFTTQEILKIWNTNPENLLIQEYLECKGGKPHLVRVIWKFPGHVTVSHISYEDVDEDNPFILTGEAYETNVFITVGTIELTRYADTLRHILEQTLSEGQSIKEIVADFVQGKSLKWYFLHVHEYKTFGKPKMLSMRSAEILRTETSTRSIIQPKIFETLSFSNKKSPMTSPTTSTRPHTNFGISRIKFRDNPIEKGVPYVKSKSREKELKLDGDINELIGKPKGSGIAHITYRSWSSRMQMGKRISPNDLLYASKIAFQASYVKKRLDHKKNQLKGLIETMTKLTTEKSPENAAERKNKEIGLLTPEDLGRFNIISKEDLRRHMNRLSFKESKEELELGAKRIDEILKKLEKSQQYDPNN